MVSTAIKYNAETRDIDFGNTNGGTGADLKMISGIDEILQSLHIRLLTVEGEDHVESRAGFPINDIIGVLDEGAIEGFVRRTIRQDPRVTSIESVSIEHNSSTRQVDIEVTMKIDDSIGAQLNVSL